MVLGEGEKPEVEVKPWAVIIVKPEIDAVFFDDHVKAVEFAQAYQDALTTVVCQSVAIFGPLNGVGVVPFTPEEVHEHNK